MATRIRSRTRTGARSRTARRAARTGERRFARGRGAQSPSGPMGLLRRVAGTMSRGRGRGRRPKPGGVGLAAKATGFVRGFLRGGGRASRGRGRR
jgi:hypothetical protein